MAYDIKMPRLVVGPRNTTVIRRTKHVGLFVKDQRRQQKLTQADLARRAGVTQRMVSEFENGKVSPTLETLFRIFDALNVRFAVVDPKIEMRENNESIW